MARGSEQRRGSFRAAMERHVNVQRNKGTKHKHLLLPRGVDVFAEEPGGRISLDIIPYFVTDKQHPDRDDEFGLAIEDTMWYRRPYRLHSQIGVANAKVVCLSSFGRKCPICEYRTDLLKPKSEGGEGLDWEDKSVGALRASARCLYYVVPKGSRKHEERPYLWDISEYCFQKLLNDNLSANDEFYDFAQINETGLTLKIVFSAEKMQGGSEYAKAAIITFATRDYVYDEKVIRGLSSLDACLDVKDYAEVKRLFYDTEEGEEADEQRAAGGASGGQVEHEEDDEPGETTSLTKPKGGDNVATLRRPARPADKEPEPEKKTVSRPAADKKDGPECPSGYRFGVDTDVKPECQECPIWGDCLDAREALERA